jgi:zinc protease
MNERISATGPVTLAGAFMLALFACPPCGAAEPAPPQKVATIEGITEYRLDNGLRVLLFPDPSTSTVTVNLTVLVGSRHEGYGETGMAHLLEHMLFKGTPTHREIPRILRDHGAQFNGTTWVDRTLYYETMPATDANLEFGIRLEADRLVNSLVRREDLASEMTVVRNEFEMGENTPQYVLSQRMMGVAYEWHNYGKSTIGNRSDIERVPIDRLQAFYRVHYQPDNAVFIVAGNFDPAKALAFVGKYFGALKRPARQLDRTYTEEPPQDGERSVVLRRVGKVGMVGAIYHIPAGPHEDFPAVQVLNRVLTSEPSGRLYKALVESKKATSVRGTAEAWHDPGVLEVLVEVSRGDSLDAARDTLIDVLERLGTEKVSAEEVERAKRQILKERELLLAKSDRLALRLSESIAQGDWRLFFLDIDRVEKVTPQDVARVAAQYLRRSNRTVGLYVPVDKPDRATVPPGPSVAALVKDYKGRAKVVAGEAFEPTPANIEKRVQRLQLPGGLKLALLPKKTRNESVVAELTLHYGSEESLAGHTSASQFLAPLLTRGTKKHTRQQLQDELDKLKVRVRPSGLIGNLSFTIEAKRQTLPALLALLGEILREPTFPADEFDVLKRETRDDLEKSLTDPRALAQRELQRRLGPYPKENVRYTPTVEESITRLEAVTVEEVRRLYTDLLGGQNGELAVVGDFDADAVPKQVQELVGDWKAAAPYQRIARPAQRDVPGARRDILTPDKENAVYVAGEYLALTDSDPDYPALEIADFLFGYPGLASRLANRVRQKEGLSYGVGSHFSADARDKAARFIMFAICNPDNIDKVDKAIQEELHRLLKDGVDEKELAEGVKGYLQGQKAQRAVDGHLAQLLATDLYEGRTFAYYADLEDKIAALKADEVTAAVRKHLDPKRLVIVRAGDFQRKKAAKE